MKYKEKDFVKILHNQGHYFEIGETVMISIAGHRDPWHEPYYSAFNRFGHCWSVNHSELSPSTRRAFMRGEVNRSSCNAIANTRPGKPGPEVLKNWDHVAQEVNATKHLFQINWNRPGESVNEIKLHLLKNNHKPSGPLIFLQSKISKLSEIQIVILGAIFGQVIFWTFAALLGLI